MRFLSFLVVSGSSDEVAGEDMPARLRPVLLFFLAAVARIVIVNYIFGNISPFRKQHITTRKSYITTAS